VKLVIGTVSVVAAVGTVKAVTVGAVVSERVMVMEALLLADTLPAASFAHAYNVLVPAVPKVYDVGAVLDHPLVAGEGALDDSPTMYPVTSRLSVAVKLVIGTVRVLAVAGTENAVTVGAVVSGSVMVMETLWLVDTLPAASLAQAYSVLIPAVPKV
jgi:hypothetical protein